MAHTDTEVVVIGGGIGGSAAALALRQAGCDVTILEKEPEFTEVGAGIQMAPNATRIMAKWGVLDAAELVGVVPKGIVMRDAVSGETLIEQETAGKAFHDLYHGDYIVIHRADVLDIFVQAARDAGAVTHTNANVGIVEDTGDGVVVECLDGTVVKAKAAVCADGVHSRSRKMFVEDDPVPSGYVAYRGTIPIDQVPGGKDNKDVQIWVGPGCHLVQYPLRAGAEFNQVAVFKSPAWEAGEREDAKWGTVEELHKAYSTCVAPVQEALGGLQTGRRWPMADRMPLDTYARGRICLLGDAAHAMLQYMAQGACQAVEDANAIGEFSKQERGSGGVDWEKAMRRYSDVRAPRASQVQRWARNWGQMWHVTGVPRMLRNELFQTIDPYNERHQHWVYSEDFIGV